MANQSIDLSTLPAPNILEPLDFESLFQARKQRFIELAPEYAEALALESSPLAICLQVESYRELLLRQRVNEAAAANLLATSQGADLEHLGAFYGVARLPDEHDETLRMRIRNSTIASSTAGSAAHYRHQAIEAAPGLIKDVSVQSPGDGLVVVTVLAKFDADAEQVLAQVKERLFDDSVKMLTDTLEVRLAQPVWVDVEAELYLNTHASELIINKLEQTLQDNWLKVTTLGWDLTPSWLHAQLHSTGIRHIELLAPTQLIDVAAHQYVMPKSISLTLKRG
ncbi:baseplate assembly protein [Pseudoalteromonas piscicida]|uniref:Baseplate assembly protein n=1 Tax=Pseudoalteromonas piscicida TaxID=43662 RepID=A0AAQ2ESN5_PSEO7|nr:MULTISPECIES: baseplate J/gp47 family protein [Pseudoalteromonas]KJY85622.1 baseplate assembly protein [Pseudoalteromonas piscicida]TMN34889.1 baseplate assembly protein [Pseudoalteromonas piscicida]TMN39040.1 baseplate assembly protein [Pseudoalteromonas piscicida]TMN49541.1 baseplate assembly protein [Pseudoalteromonas piscicida]TMN50119.1 baseplate assembly protein [Pseudoalteromonas piscicida]